MTDRCEIPRCRGQVELIYLDHGICADHWNQFTAEGVPSDRLRMVLGLGADVPTAMEENGMATKRTATTKKRAATKAATKKTKAAKPKQAQATKPRRVFAVRITDDELAAIHRAAGPRNASRFIRAVAAAFAKADESAFRAILKEAAQARS